MDNIKKRQYRTIDQVEEEYYRNHPDEIDIYLATPRWKSNNNSESIGNYGTRI